MHGIDLWADFMEFFYSHDYLDPPPPCNPEGKYKFFIINEKKGTKS
jgi:hypothetical protein